LLKKLYIALGLILQVFFALADAAVETDSAGGKDPLQYLHAEGFFNPVKQGYVRGKPSRNIAVYIAEKGKLQRFSPSEYVAIQDAWLYGQLNTGYPFANYQIKPDSVSGTLVFVTVSYDSGPRCFYDSISGNGLKLSPYFMKTAGTLGIGMVYCEQDVQRFRSKMLAVDGYMLKGETEPYFHYGKFVLNHAVVRQKRDRLSGLMGVATEANKRPVITGEADAAFYDLFGHGVSFYARWRRFQARSQELFAGTELPYLLGSPFVLGFHLGLEKYDTVYTRLKRSVVLRFPVSRQWRWSMGVERTGITGLGIDTLWVKSRRSLPYNAPSRNSGYMVSIEKTGSAGEAFPRRGSSFKLEATVGSRIWLRDANLAAISWKNREGNQENIFDSLDRIGKLRQTTWRLRYSGMVLIPVMKNWVGAVSIMGEEYQAPNMNFAELSRWGGINSIRGFNEQRIFANSFHMANVEFRFMAGTSGYVAPFFSAAVYRNSTALQTDLQAIQSFGLAGALKTGAGILKFAWALGNDGNGYVFRDAKFHLGLSNAF
jgi:hypothetical protein